MAAFTSEGTKSKECLLIAFEFWFKKAFAGEARRGFVETLQLQWNF